MAYLNDLLSERKKQRSALHAGIKVLDEQIRQIEFSISVGKKLDKKYGADKPKPATKPTPAKRKKAKAK